MHSPCCFASAAPVNHHKLTETSQGIWHSFLSISCNWEQRELTWGMHSPNHVLITGWSWHAESIPSCGLQKWEGFAWFSCSVPWCHLLPNLVGKWRGRGLAKKANRIKTTWTYKQLLQGQTFGIHKMCSLKPCLYQMCHEVLSPVDSVGSYGT